MPDTGLNKAGMGKGVTAPVPMTAPDSAGFQVVAIGASAGGPEALKKLLDALPVPSGMAFILVQHLAPTHRGKLVELLAEHTHLAVVEAADGIHIEPEYLYVIPPGAYLSVSNGTLRLSPPEMRGGARRGARLPFDMLLRSLADEYGPRVACVVLSGSGNDGCAGLRVVKAAGGFAVAQDPAEADYDGMPRSAIATGDVDVVTSAAEIPQALLAKRTGRTAIAASKSATGADAPGAVAPDRSSADLLSQIIELTHARTGYDFTPYKLGTLTRRIERRMALASLKRGELSRYLKLLQHDADELDLLAKDLLIHVTSFFRDPAAYACLAETVIPALLHGHAENGAPAVAPDRPVRVWVAGCSTGEEAYSIVMLFHEAMAALGGNAGPGAAPLIKLQVFASDLDHDAVAIARAGLYPASITADVSAERLARFFSKEDGYGYRVLPELRGAVVFTVQDLLSDPPFSRLDLISCRNLMIYLGTEAQTKAAALFHFALNEGGCLLLGNAETVSETDGRFRMVEKAARLYRHVGPKRPADLSFIGASPGANGVKPARPDRAPVLSRQTRLAELCRQTVLDQHAPAAVLCDAQHACLYLLGPTDSYLQVPPGQVTDDLVMMARRAVRPRLRAALMEAAQTGVRVTAPGGGVRDGHRVSFTIDVQPLQHDGEALFLVCFVDAPHPVQESGARRKLPAGAGTPPRFAAPRVAEFEREIDALRAELKASNQALEASAEDQRAVNKEARSISEDFQSTNEELLTSKEEVQSLNEELTALNSQLQETVDRQRTTSDDLQNILYSTDVATLFLDRDMGIRFFTPAIRALFNIIPGDIGRPLADLHSLATDTLLPADARAVLHDRQPVEREIETPDGVWFRRRILPYHTSRAAGGGVEGVVITFTDISRRKQETAALEVAKQAAEAANRAKSRFLGAASHDLRQPMQTLALLQGLLAGAVAGTTGSDRAAGLVARMDDTLSAMTGMLNTLADINQIEAGVVRAELSNVHVDSLLTRMRDEFTDHAQAKGLKLLVMPCSVTIRTDPRLLEQMLRNLIANALKYTDRGRVLVGCRRHGTGGSETVSIEVWDTGIGIPFAELDAVFDEYHQVDNVPRDRSHGLGLGLAIVQRLGKLLGHPLGVRSRPGKGSVFTVNTPRVFDAVQSGPLIETAATGPEPAAAGQGVTAVAGNHVPSTGTILVIEDDPDLLDLLQTLLLNAGWLVKAVPDGPAALAVLHSGVLGPHPPCLLLADYTLPGGINGLQAVDALRQVVHGPSAGVTPAIILTGDISAATLQAIANQDCLHLSKPISPRGLITAIEGLLAGGSRHPAAAHHPPASDAPIVFVVDDDAGIRSVMRDVLEQGGYVLEDYAGGEPFLTGYGAGRPGRDTCLLVDAAMPGMDGLEVLRRLSAAGHHLPAIVITGHGDVPMAVQAMKAGALDFIEKPVSLPDLLASIGRAMDQSRDAGARSAWQAAASGSIAGLTPRQRDIMSMVLAGQPSKNIAADLGISQRTVENHRAAIMHKTGARSLPALARLALAAEG